MMSIGPQTENLEHRRPERVEEVIDRDDLREGSDSPFTKKWFAVIAEVWIFATILIFVVVRVLGSHSASQIIQHLRNH